MNTIRIFIVIAAASLAVASLIHSGVLMSGYEDRSAAIAEGVIASVMVVGLFITWASDRWALVAGRGALLFGLAGTTLGLFLVLIGVGPRTVADLVYHIALFLFLVVGVAISWRAPSRARA